MTAILKGQRFTLGGKTPKTLKSRHVEVSNDFLTGEPLYTVVCNAVIPVKLRSTIKVGKLQLKVVYIEYAVMLDQTDQTRITCIPLMPTKKVKNV